MYNNGEKFRCHISMISEKIFGLLTLWVGIVVAIFKDEDNLKEAKKIFAQVKKGDYHVIKENMVDIIGVVAVVIVITALYAIYAYFVWKNTYIQVIDNTIKYEKDFLGKKVKSISIQNISNVNIEQNLVRSIFGTYVIKIDTNSKSTAGENDFRIVLASREAHEFRDYVNRVSAEFDGYFDDDEQLVAEHSLQVKQESIDDEFVIEYSADNKKEENVEKVEYKATFRDTLRHGFVNSGIIGALVLVISMATTISWLEGKLFDLPALKGLSKLVIILLIVIASIIIIVYKIVRKCLDIYGYEVVREFNKIKLNYGVINKIDYAMPVSKINSIKIKQSLLGRILKLYRVDVVNIGMNDEEHEEDTCLFLYDTYDNICKKMDAVLPEFSASMDLTYDKQNKSALWFIIAEALCNVATFLIVPLILYAFNKTYAMFALLGVGVILVVALFNSIVSLFTEGTYFGEDYIKCVTGVTEKTYQWIAYDKIQYVDFYYNGLSRKSGVMYAKVHILAKLVDTNITLPFFALDKGEKLRKYVIEKECNMI